MTTSCAIAAEYETPYLKEWCEWHFKLGFDKLVIYANNWTTDALAFAKYTDFGGYVEFRIFDGKCQQLNAYNDAISRNDSDWIAFLDCDEFIVLKKHDNINAFLADYADCQAIGLNWKLFGSNGHTKYEDKPVIQRFTRSQIGVNQHIKTIVNVKLAPQARFTHDPHHVNAGAWSPERIRVNGPFNYVGLDNIAYIAHFCTKSKAECIARRSRPRADCGVPREDLDNFFKAHDCNDVENLDLQKGYL